MQWLLVIGSMVPDATDKTRQCDNYNRGWYKRRNNIVSYEFLYYVLFSSMVREAVRVRVRFSGWLVTGYAHVLRSTFGCQRHTVATLYVQPALAGRTNV